MDPKVSSVLKSHKGCLVYPYSGVREAGIQLLPRPIRSNESDLDQSYRTPGKASESSSTSPAISRQKDASHQSFTSQNSSVTQPHSRPFTPHPSVGNTNVLSPQPPVNSKSYPQFGRKELQEVVAHGEKNIDRTDLITALQAGWNVTNAIQGMFIVSFPYAVLQGGYWALFAMVATAYICCHTGQILIDCLYEEVETPANPVGDGQLIGLNDPATERWASISRTREHEQQPPQHEVLPSADPNHKRIRVRVRATYVEIAEAVWGRWLGGHLVNAAQLIELLMTCILYLVLCGDLMKSSFPSLGLGVTGWMVCSSVLLLPCALLTSLRTVSFMSFWNTVTHLIINAGVIAYCLTRTADWNYQVVQFQINIWTFPISLGIIVFSYTSQIFLPSLEGNMHNRAHFSGMLIWTHVAAAIFKVAFGYIGVITFGQATQDEVTKNLTHSLLKVALNSALVVKSLLSYPLPYYAAVRVLESQLFNEWMPIWQANMMDDSVANLPCSQFPQATAELKGYIQPEDGDSQPGPASSWFPRRTNRIDRVGAISRRLLLCWRSLALRAALILFTLVMAIFIPHFALLMGLIGSFTGTMLSFVWPAIFHLALKRGQLAWYTRLGDMAIALIGCVSGVFGIFYASRALHRVMNGEDIDPEKIKSNLPILLYDNATACLEAFGSC